jgi:hypothetical protein
MTLGNRKLLVGIAALAALAAMFFVGRAGGTKERTTHVRAKQKEHAVVVVKEKSPRLATISAGALADLVSLPQQQPSSSQPGSSPPSGSTGSPDIIGSG